VRMVASPTTFDFSTTLERPPRIIRINEVVPGLRLYLLFDRDIDAATIDATGYVIRLRDEAAAITQAIPVDARTVRLDVMRGLPNPGTDQVDYSSPPGVLAGLDEALVESYVEPIILI